MVYDYLKDTVVNLENAKNDNKYLEDLDKEIENKMIDEQGMLFQSDRNYGEQLLAYKRR